MFEREKHHFTVIELVKSIQKELVLWCSREVKDVVVFYWKMCNLGSVGFQTYLCFRIDSVDVRKIWAVFGKE